MDRSGEVGTKRQMSLCCHIYIYVYISKVTKEKYTNC